MTTTWVYLVSKFTPELLLAEGFVICLLLSGYTAFWVIRKRRYGVVDKSLPAGPVKDYLNELIINAEQLRAQLFGLLGGSGGQVPDWTTLGSMNAPAPGLQLGATPSAAALLSANLAAGTGGAVPSPEAGQKIALLETKMAEQAKALESISAEKARLEAELTQAKTALSGAGAPSSSAPAGGESAGGAVDQGQLRSMQQKIQELEAKLAEYNVIEDDLANLKRLQQENNQLKAQIGGAAPPPAAPQAAAAPAPIAAAPPAPAPVPEPAPLAPTPAAPVPAAVAAPASPAPTPVAAPAAAAPVADASAPPAPGAESAPAAAPPADADLVAEFEKMLRG